MKEQAPFEHSWPGIGKAVVINVGRSQKNAKLVWRALLDRHGSEFLFEIENIGKTDKSDWFVILVNPKDRNKLSLIREEAHQYFQRLRKNEVGDCSENIEDDTAK